MCVCVKRVINSRKPIKIALISNYALHIITLFIFFHHTNKEFREEKSKNFLCKAMSDSDEEEETAIANSLLPVSFTDRNSFPPRKQEN